jgi:hypothetical protein
MLVVPEDSVAGFARAAASTRQALSEAVVTEKLDSRRERHPARSAKR